MRIALALVLSSSAVVAAAPRRAAADCASPQVAVGPSPGATLPPDPTLYVFLATPYGREPWTDLEVIAGGQVLPAQVAVASRTDALTVLRIQVETGDQRSIEVRRRASPRSWSAEFTVEARRRRVDRPPLRLRSARHERDEWMCSFTDAWLLSPATVADAYRVEWAATPSAWARGEHASAIFPRNEMDLWSHAVPSGGSTPPSIALGHVSCFAYTIPEPAVRGPLYVKVTGLYADGSETAAWKEPRRLGESGGGSDPRSPPPTVAPAELTSASTAPAELTSATTAPAPPAAPTEVASAAAGARSWSTAALVLGLAGLALVGVARRLRRAPRVAPPP